MVQFVHNFNGWIAGELHDWTSTAPATPLSPDARQAAATVALDYMHSANLTDGYVIAYRDGKLAFRCPAKSTPSTDR